MAETAYNTQVGSPTGWLWEKCDYDGAEKCPVGLETSWGWQAPASEGLNKTPQGGPTSFIWGSESAPPVEYTEEQTQNSVPLCNLRSGSYTRAAQRLTISDRIVSKLAFYIKRTGTATGTVAFTIRKVSDDSLINSKDWGDAGDLPTEFAWQEAEFDAPVIVSEEVRISVEFSGGSSGNEVQVSGETSDVKADEYFQWYTAGAVWATPAAWDFAYRYKYYEV